MVDVFALSVAAIVLGAAAVVGLLAAGVYMLTASSSKHDKAHELLYKTRRTDADQISLSEMGVDGSF
jgi:hypothetical protein